MLGMNSDTLFALGNLVYLLLGDESLVSSYTKEVYENEIEALGDDEYGMIPVDPNAATLLQSVLITKMLQEGTRYLRGLTHLEGVKLEKMKRLD